jgi:chemotaxis-related protein WspD
MTPVSSARELPVEDCWNRIGVQGDRSCPELRAHAHCKNCPVFASAARVALDRELPEGYAQSWARRFADGAADEAAEAEGESWLIFRVGVEWLGLRTAVVDEVSRVPPLHSLPHRRGGAVLGLVNVRGELVVCVSLPRALGVELAPAPAASAGRARERLLVLRRGGSRFALPVAEVHGTRRVDEGEFVPTPATLGKARGVFTRHVLPWADKAIGCLDDDGLWRALERSLA